MIGRFALGLVLVVLLSADATAIPAFARKYRVSCQLCHNPVPTLTDFGETFAGNGFRFAADEQPRDTIDTGDRMLELLSDIPLAVRFDAYLQGFVNGGVSRDFKTPYNVKILSGGSLFSGVSYYFYFFLFERGEVTSTTSVGLLSMWRWDSSRCPIPCSSASCGSNSTTSPSTAPE
jgi:hypothetical protein